jgi:hypothetical protein
MPNVSDDLARRRSLLTTALVVASLRPDVPERRILRARLDTWQGIGHVTVGMDRQGYDLQFTKYADRGWRATFYTSGMEHAATGTTGSAWPWRPLRPTPSRSHVRGRLPGPVTGG